MATILRRQTRTSVGLSAARGFSARRAAGDRYYETDTHFEYIIIMVGDTATWNLITAGPGSVGKLTIRARVASTGAINLATIAVGTVDGVQTVAGDIVLVKNQASAIDNGLYTVQAGTWARTVGYDSSSPLNLPSGTIVVVTEGLGPQASVGTAPSGSQQANSLWVLKGVTPNTALIIGTDPLAFVNPTVDISAAAAATAQAASGTINGAMGRFIVSASATYVLTNSLITTSSLVFGQLMTVDGTKYISAIVPTAQTATFTFSAALTAGTVVAFRVFNPSS